MATVSGFQPQALLICGVSINNPASPIGVVRIVLDRVYGQTKIYPACEVARTFAEFAGTKTLRPEDLRRISSLGYAINVDANARLMGNG